jgi:hypothetical protein
MENRPRLRPRSQIPSDAVHIEDPGYRANVLNQPSRNSQAYYRQAIFNERKLFLLWRPDVVYTREELAGRLQHEVSRSLEYLELVEVNCVINRAVAVFGEPLTFPGRFILVHNGNIVGAMSENRKNLSIRYLARNL